MGTSMMAGAFTSRCPTHLTALWPSASRFALNSACFCPDNLDDVTAAAIANPGMSSCAALKERAKLIAGETVLVNGATGTSGKLAVQIAKHMGAKKVIATGRDLSTLQSLTKLGADVTIPLVQDGQALEDAFTEQFRNGIDVVVDYLWGMSAERLLLGAAKGSKSGKQIRFVQVGSVSGQDITLPSACPPFNPSSIDGKRNW